MKSVLFLSFVASAVSAQSSSSAPTASSSSTPSATSNPLIPTGISSTCSAFLTSFNTNTDVATCVAPIIAASSQFGPGSNSSSDASVSTIKSALDTLCSNNVTSCGDSVFRTQLANFYTACPDELSGSSNNTDVRRTYDMLYAFTPLKNALCTKDDSGNYCATQIKSGSLTTSSSSATPSAAGKEAIAVSHSAAPYEIVQSNLYSDISAVSLKRRDTTAALVPNTTAYALTNLVFLFLNPNMTNDALCTTCTKNVMTAYIDFEETVPYASSLSTSPLMSGQSTLYTAIQNKCGQSFLGGVVQAAGGLGAGLIGAAPRTFGDFSSVTALLAAATVGFATLL